MRRDQISLSLSLSLHSKKGSNEKKLATWFIANTTLYNNGKMSVRRCKIWDKYSKQEKYKEYFTGKGTFDSFNNRLESIKLFIIDNKRLPKETEKLEKKTQDG